MSCNHRSLVPVPATVRGSLQPCDPAHLACIPTWQEEGRGPQGILRVHGVLCAHAPQAARRRRQHSRRCGWRARPGGLLTPARTGARARARARTQTRSSAWRPSSWLGLGLASPRPRPCPRPNPNPNPDPDPTPTLTPAPTPASTLTLSPTTDPNPNQVGILAAIFMAKQFERVVVRDMRRPAAFDEVLAAAVEPHAQS